MAPSKTSSKTRKTPSPPAGEIRSRPLRNTRVKKPSTNRDTKRKTAASTAADRAYNRFCQLKRCVIDKPDHVLCVECNEFHERPADPSDYNIGGEGCKSNVSIVLGGPVRLAFWGAHLVMRAQRLSPKHGIPLRDMMIESYGPNDLVVNTRLSQDGRLYVKVTDQQSLQLERPEVLRLDEFPLCPHLLGFEATWVTKIVRKAISGFTDAYTLCYRGHVWRCRVCSSAYRVQIDVLGHNGEVLKYAEVSEEPDEVDITNCRFSFSRYMDLGPCEGGNDRDWMPMHHARVMKPTQRPMVSSRYEISIAKHYDEAVRPA